MDKELEDIKRRLTIVEKTVALHGAMLCAEEGDEDATSPLLELPTEAEIQRTADEVKHVLLDLGLTLALKLEPRKLLEWLHNENNRALIARKVSEKGLSSEKLKELKTAQRRLFDQLSRLEQAKEEGRKAGTISRPLPKP